MAMCIGMRRDAGRTHRDERDQTSVGEKSIEISAALRGEAGEGADIRVWTRGPRATKGHRNDQNNADQVAKWASRFICKPMSLSKVAQSKSEACW
jgi:hypothetical protein